MNTTTHIHTQSLGSLQNIPPMAENINKEQHIILSLIQHDSFGKPLLLSNGSYTENLPNSSAHHSAEAGKPEIAPQNTSANQQETAHHSATTEQAEQTAHHHAETYKPEIAPRHAATDTQEATPYRAEPCSQKTPLSSNKAFDKNIDWNVLFTELDNQSLLMLAGTYLSTMAPPPWKQDFLAAQQLYEVKNKRLLKVQDKLVTHLTQNQIPFVIFKGVSAGYNYRHPELRQYGDIDILVPPECMTHTINILKTLPQCEYTEADQAVRKFFERNTAFATCTQAREAATNTQSKEATSHTSSQLKNAGISNNALPTNTTSAACTQASEVATVSQSTCTHASNSAISKRKKMIPSRGQHVSFCCDHIEIELHYRLSNLPHNAGGDNLMEKLYQCCYSPEIIELQGHSAPVPPTYLSGAILLLHIRQHLRVGLGLRQLIDWMNFVNKHLNKETWKNFFTHLSCKELEQLAQVATYTCCKYLGLPREKLPPQTGITANTISVNDQETLADLFINYIFEHGNFGTKVIQSGKGRGAKTFTQIKNPFKFLSYAQRQGMHDWKTAQKHAVLIPFCWAWKLCNWTHYALNRKNALRQLKTERKLSKQRRLLYKNLGLTD